MPNFQDLTGERFNHWTVIEELGNGKVLCECDCGTRKVLYKKAVKGGRTKSCGCEHNNKNVNVNKDKDIPKSNSKYIELRINELTVKGIEGQKFICDCSCGKKDIKVYASHVIRGYTKSCGHIKQEMRKTWVGNQYGSLKVISELNDTRKVLCECLCGTQVEVFKSALERGKTRSCGCMQSELARKTMNEVYGERCSNKIYSPREEWQIDTISSKENLEKFLKAYNRKVKIPEISSELGVNNTSIWRIVHKYDLDDYIEDCRNSSYLEDEIADYISQITNDDILRHVRGFDKQSELDIYIPSKKIAIEVNGVYWHSDKFKDKYYHQSKTVACEKVGIRLIHIFESEWINNNQQIRQFLFSQISDKKRRVYARKCSICEIESSVANEFIQEYHMQGKVNSSINIGLYYDTELIGVMTFGKPRYSIEYEYELLRLCFKSDTIVVGGAEKMFKHFITRYGCNSIISYCDITKFNGDVYSRLGFKLVGITEPNYFWVNSKYEVYSRYQTQKHKLIADGFGELGDTEEEIMVNRGYNRVYTSGNKKFIYRKES